MAREDTPDRRPLLYGIAALLILCAALFLFWPRGPKNELSTMTLTPPSAENQVQAGQVNPEDSATASSDELAKPEETPQESLSTEDQRQQAVAPKQSQPEPSSIKAVTPAQTASSSPAPPNHEKTAQKLNTSLVQPTSSGRYLLNLGSFGSHSNAQRRVDELRANGVPADVAQGTKPDGSPIYRVRVAYFEGHSLAKAYGEDLKRRLGLDYWISER
ncbi:MAG TPA: SPOR domain-containing protein [Candidatus Krumholzibacteria bacterium]|nr:SPOR domain-containing protein [Candidatus Krumholzibacteria bacterium]